MLAKIPGLRVASRTSAFSFKGTGRRHHRRSRASSTSRRCSKAACASRAQRVRITAQLVEAASDSHLWSQTYDRELDDIFAVQDDIARSVVKELRSALLGEQPDAAASARVQAQVRAATRGRTAEREAHELYLLGRFLVDRMNPDDNVTAIGYYRQALQLDPHYALAWAGLAGAYSNQADYGWAPMAKTVELARAAARHALELEPELAEAHAELGWVQMCQWDWRDADASYARALELGAGDRSIVIAASVLADSLGRKDRSGGAGAPRGGAGPVELHRARQPRAALPELGVAGRGGDGARSGVQAQPARRAAAHGARHVAARAAAAGRSAGRVSAGGGGGAAPVGNAMAQHALGRHAESEGDAAAS